MAAVPEALINLLSSKDSELALQKVGRLLNLLGALTGGHAHALTPPRFLMLTATSYN